MEDNHQTHHARRTSSSVCIAAMTKLCKFPSCDWLKSEICKDVSLQNQQECQSREIDDALGNNPAVKNACCIFPVRNKSISVIYRPSDKHMCTRNLDRSQGFTKLITDTISFAVTGSRKMVLNLDKPVSRGRNISFMSCSAMTFPSSHFCRKNDVHLCNEQEYILMTRFAPSIQGATEISLHSLNWLAINRNKAFVVQL